jgi:hypothetical protein
MENRADGNVPASGLLVRRIYVEEEFWIYFFCLQTFQYLNARVIHPTHYQILYYIPSYSVGVAVSIGKK